VWDSCELKTAIENGNMNIPGPSPLPETDELIDHYFVADAAFPLETYVMKSFSGAGLPVERKIYNYRLYKK